VCLCSWRRDEASAVLSARPQRRIGRAKYIDGDARAFARDLSHAPAYARLAGEPKTWLHAGSTAPRPTAMHRRRGWRGGAAIPCGWLRKWNRLAVVRLQPSCLRSSFATKASRNGPASVGSSESLRASRPRSAAPRPVSVSTTFGVRSARRARSRPQGRERIHQACRAEQRQVALERGLRKRADASQVGEVQDPSWPRGDHGGEARKLRELFDIRQFTHVALEDGAHVAAQPLAASLRAPGAPTAEDGLGGTPRSAAALGAPRSRFRRRPCRAR
jgi:hypothetical protein